MRISRRDLLRLGVPLLVGGVMLAFAGREPAQAPAPTLREDTLALVQDDPCALLTSAEVGVLLRTTFNDFTPDYAGGFARCSYLGFRESEIPLVETSVASGDALARAGTTAQAQLDELGAEASAPSVEVEGLGDDARWIARGAGELWVRVDDDLVGATVLRDGDGDAEAARAVVGALLAKLRLPPEAVQAPE